MIGTQGSLVLGGFILWGSGDRWLSALPVYSAENRDTPSAFAGLLLHSLHLGPVSRCSHMPGEDRSVRGWGCVECAGSGFWPDLDSSTVSTSFWGLLLFLSGQSIKVKGTVTSLTHPRGKPAQHVTVDSRGQRRDKSSKCRRKGTCKCEGYGRVGAWVWSLVSELDPRSHN